MSKRFVSAIALAAVTAGAATAQTATFDNQDQSSTAVDKINEQITSDADRNLGAFGTEGREIGTYGSVSVRGTSTSNDGSTENDLGLGLRYGSFDGVNAYDVTASFAYGTLDGVETKNQTLLGLNYARNFGSAFFAYGKANASFDKLSTTAGEFTQDLFVGAGIGYRIFNDRDTQWSVQAGPGYRVATAVGGEEVNQAAASVSSNLYKSLSEGIYLSNDTDVIYSEYATTVKNELALNVSVSDNLTMRTSYTTNFNDQTDNSFKDAENTLGVSLVYGFN